MINMIEYWPIDRLGKVFANGPGEQGSIQGQAIPKTQNIVLDTPCLTLSII